MLSEWITKWLYSLLPKFTPWLALIYISCTKFFQGTTHSLSYSATISMTYRNCVSTEDGASESASGYQKCFMEEVLFELHLGGLRGREEREGSLGGRRGTVAGEESQGSGRAYSCWLLPRVQEIRTSRVSDSSPLQAFESRRVSLLLHARILGHQSLRSENLPHPESQEHPSGLCPDLPGGPSQTYIPQEVWVVLGVPSESCDASMRTAFYCPSFLRTPPLEAPTQYTVEALAHCRAH